METMDGTLTERGDPVPAGRGSVSRLSVEDPSPRSVSVFDQGKIA